MYLIDLEIFRNASEKLLNLFKNMRMKHHDLCVICWKLNKAYTIQILLIVLQAFTTIMVLFYYAGDMLLNTENLQTNIVYCFYFTLQFFTSVSHLGFLVISCSKTCEEVFLIRT